MYSQIIPPFRVAWSKWIRPARRGNIDKRKRAAPLRTWNFSADKAITFAPPFFLPKSEMFLPWQKREIYPQTAARREGTWNVCSYSRKAALRKRCGCLRRYLNAMSAQLNNKSELWNISSSSLFSHFLLFFTSLIFFNNSHWYNSVLAIFWL